MSETRTPSTSDPEVGTAERRAGTRHFYGAYVGDDPTLKGHHAMLMLSVDEGHVVAQFDDHKTGKGYGWWKFPEEDFLEDPLEAYHVV